MSQLTYNGVTLPYPYTTYFSMDFISDESNTDLMYIKYDVEVQCVINARYASILSEDFIVNNNVPSYLNSAGIMAYLESKLMMRRKRLSYTFNNTEIIPPLQPGNTDYVDAKNGPIPQYCRFTHVTNETFLMNYKITAHFFGDTVIKRDVESPITYRAGSPVLSNRWKETLSIDGSSNLTTRTRNGKFIIRADNQELKAPDFYRDQFAILSVPNGCIRKKAEYTIDANGLGIEYTIIDQEVYRLPPAPALTANGVYKEYCASGGANRTAHIKVRLTGDKGTTATQDKLIQTAVGVAASKLNLEGIALFPGAGVAHALVTGASISLGLYDNIVEAEIVALFPQVKFRVEGVNFLRNTATVVPGSDGTSASPSYPDYGTLNSYKLLQAAAYYDPSVLNNKLNRTTGQMNNGVVPGRDGR